MLETNILLFPLCRKSHDLQMNIPETKAIDSTDNFLGRAWNVSEGLYLKISHIIRIIKTSYSNRSNVPTEIVLGVTSVSC